MKYKLIYFFIVTYLLLTISFYISLENIDRMNIYKSLYGNLFGNKDLVCPIPMHKLYIIGHISMLLICHILGKRFYDSVMKGYFISIAGIYSDHMDAKIGDITKFCNKVQWYEIAKKYNIKTPEIRIIIDSNGKHNVINKYEPNKNYIAKPINGLLGLGVKLIKGKNIKNYVIQDYLRDCTIPSNDSQIYRYITLYNVTEYILLRFTKKNSNITAYADNQIICEGSCKLVELAKMCHQLKKLHKNEYPFVFSIGWDIMINCDNNGIKTAYLLEGNAPHNVFTFDIYKHQDYVKKYKDEAVKFYKIYNLI